MFVLPRLTSRSSRSLALMLVRGAVSTVPGRWPAGSPDFRR